jgi:hypothetical protein
MHTKHLIFEKEVKKNLNSYSSLSVFWRYWGLNSEPCPCTWAMPPSLFALVYISAMVSHFCLRSAWDPDSPTSTPWVAGITDVYHHTQHILPPYPPGIHGFIRLPQDNHSTSCWCWACLFKEACDANSLFAWREEEKSRREHTWHTKAGVDKFVCVCVC